jgi:hypothetical protein
MTVMIMITQTEKMLNKTLTLIMMVGRCVCRWVNVLGKLVLAQLPDETQRLSSQSNSSASSGSSDTTTSSNNNNTASGKLSQADSGCVADRACGDNVAESSPVIGEQTDDQSVDEKL